MKGLIVILLLLIVLTGCATEFKPEYYQDNGLCYAVVRDDGGEIEAMVIVDCMKVKHIAINNDIER